MGSDFLVSEDPLSVSITSPLLRRLTFGIDYSVDKVSVVSAPSLEQMQIFIWNYTDSTLKKLPLMSLGLLTSVAMVSSLNLNTLFLKEHAFYRRTKCKDMVLDVVSLVNNSMLITCLCYSDEDNWVEIIKEELHGNGISCLNQTLKCVAIETDNDMIGITFRKFFMLKAKILKLMKFNCCARSNIEPGMIEELQKAELTSFDAKVVIFCDLEDAPIDVI